LGAGPVEFEDLGIVGGECCSFFSYRTYNHGERN
jgi:hypothetical protein